MVGMVDLHEAPASSACPGSVRRCPRHRRTWRRFSARFSTEI